MSPDYSTLDVAARAEQAVTYFKSGYNCAQAVYMAYADLFGMDSKTAAVIAAPMGAGIGRMREVCGTVSGAALIAGLAIPCDNPTDMAAKTRCYALVQQVADRFSEANGSIICRELLGIAPIKESPTPSPRTEAYYKKRPCVELVRMSATFIGEELKKL
ncbi:MAG: C_GCAxxG_C_C family protein [Bacteroidales bacterium]|nr:C_GCAxxG_C_C family protein [Bacteroidales bacterium]